MTLIRKANAAPSNKLRRFIPLPYLRGLYGLTLSAASPLGWIIIQFMIGRDPFSEEYFDSLLYWYMSIASAAYNKRYFTNRLKQEFDRHLRSHSPMAIIRMDIDFFKKINDNSGHQTGDEAIYIAKKTE
ncbi:MAG: hypothetical protein ACI8O8_000450 [Oleiphilaceae bacterium]|jgi:hypothetical protein